MASTLVDEQYGGWVRDLRRGVLLTSLQTVLEANPELAALVRASGYHDRLRAAETAVMQIPRPVREAAVTENVAPVEFAQAIGYVRPLVEEAVNASLGLIVLNRAVKKDPDLRSVRLSGPAALAQLGTIARRQGESVAISSLYGKVYVLWAVQTAIAVAAAPPPSPRTPWRPNPNPTSRRRSRASPRIPAIVRSNA